MVKAGAGVVPRVAELRPGGGSRRYLCRRPENSRNSSDLARLSPTQTRQPAGDAGCGVGAGGRGGVGGALRAGDPELSRPRGPGRRPRGCGTCRKRQEGRPLHEAPVGVQEVARVEPAGGLPLRLVQEHGAQEGHHRRAP